MKKTITVSLIILSITSTLWAQDNSNTQSISKPERNSSPHEIGLAAGFVTGYGLSYRYWPKKVGVQLTAFPLISNDESYVSAGITGLFELDSSNWYRFFAYVGGNINIQEYNNEYYNNYPYTDYETERVEETKFTTGFGPGIEFTPGGKIGLNIMTGFQYYYVDKNDWGTLPTIEGAIYFRF